MAGRWQASDYKEEWVPQDGRVWEVDTAVEFTVATELNYVDSREIEYVANEVQSLIQDQMWDLQPEVLVYPAEVVSLAVLRWRVIDDYLGANLVNIELRFVGDNWEVRNCFSEQEAVQRVKRVVESWTDKGCGSVELVGSLRWK